MAYAKIKKQDDNILGAGGMAGNTESTGNPSSQNINKSGSGASGGFTNIQDYMNANKGDMTNQNYLNQKADTQISNLANTLNTNVGALSAINQNPAASQQGLQDILKTNAYDKAKNYATAPDFKATAEELPDIYSGSYNPTSKLTGNLSSVMDYIGEIKPPSQEYTSGMQKFDEMLLGGDKNFAKDFATNKQAQYKSQVEDPYGAAVTAREGQKTKAKEGADAWTKQFQDYIGGEDKKLKDILAKQQKQEKGEADLTFEEWLPLYQEAAKKNPSGTAPGAPAYLAPGFDYMDYAQRSGYNTPSTGTAATAYGQENLLDYNALASLLGLDQLTASNTYNPGKWSLKGLF